MKISIIIPMFNAGKYIANCLDSILKSDLPENEYEVIVIDDGSKDNSKDVVQEYMTKSSLIQLICQENQGQSVARNNGILQCRGEYVWFIDADDKVDLNLAPIVHFLEKDDLDILGIQLRSVTENDEFIRMECSQPLVEHDLIITGRHAVISGYNPSSVCALITKRELFKKNKLYFVAGITHQDVELSYRMMTHARRVLFSNFSPYIYIQHPTSVSHSNEASKRKKYLSDDITIIHSFEKLSKEFAISDPELSSAIATRIQNIQFGMVWSLLKNKRELKKLGIYNDIFSLLKSEHLYPMKLNFYSWKKNLMVYLINMKIFTK